MMKAIMRLLGSGPLPAGYILQRNGLGEWRFVSPSGQCSWLPIFTRRGAVMSAWDHKAHEKERELERRWKTVEEGE